MSPVKNCIIINLQFCWVFFLWTCILLCINIVSTFSVCHQSSIDHTWWYRFVVIFLLSSQLILVSLWAPCFLLSAPRFFSLRDFISYLSLFFKGCNANIHRVYVFIYIVNPSLQFGFQLFLTYHIRWSRFLFRGWRKFRSIIFWICLVWWRTHNSFFGHDSKTQTKCLTSTKETLEWLKAHVLPLDHKLPQAE